MTETVIAAYSAYRAKCAEAKVRWSDNPSADGAMRRKRIKAEVCEEFGLDIFAFELDKMETFMEAAALRRSLLGDHTGAEDLTYKGVIWYERDRFSHLRLDDLSRLSHAASRRFGA